MTTSERMQESELKLVVVSNEPESVLAQIASVSTLPGYRLSDAGRRSIRDIYFDTRNRALSAQGWALRLRAEDHRQLITLKGPSRTDEGQAPSRFEFEAPWSPEALSRVGKMLAKQQLLSSVPRLVSGTDSPEQSLDSLGLVPLTDRQTDRLLKEAREIATSAHVAHVMIDRVTYVVDSRTLHHHEVEIEAVDETTADAAVRLAEELIDTFGPVLRRYDHSKLAIGLGLGILKKSGRLDGLTNRRGNLLPRAYEAIHQELSTGRITAGSPLDQQQVWDWKP